MKPAPLNLSTPLMPQNFAPPVSPGCPTDGIVTGHAFLPPWATDADHPFTSISRSLSLNATIPTSEALPPSVWRIEPGSYITFELDTAAAAASLPQDSEGYNQILALPVNRYIGLVSSSTTHADTEELVVHYVAREPPPLTGACLPLAPSSRLASPAPGLLHVAPMFPWPDLVQWTTHGVRLAVAARTDSVLCFALADASLGAFEDQVVLDASGPCVPVRVWRDVREAGAGGGGEPGAFEAEVERLEELLSECRVDDDDDDDDDTGDIADDEASTDSDTLFDGDMDDSDHADGDVTMRVDDEL